MQSMPQKVRTGKQSKTMRECNFADDVDCTLGATHVGLFIDNNQKGYACDLHVYRLESVACLK